MASGYKICPSCSRTCSAISATCVGCNHTFFERRPRKKRTSKVKNLEDQGKIDWTKLEIGSIIRVSGGPYKVGERSGYKVPMGHKGKFKVLEIHSDALLCYPVDGKGGYSRVYMGPDYISEETGIHFTSHVVKKEKSGE